MTQQVKKTNTRKSEEFRTWHHFTLNAAWKHSWHKRLRTFIRIIEYLSQNQTAAFLRGAARPPAGCVQETRISDLRCSLTPSQPADPERNIEIIIDIRTQKHPQRGFTASLHDSNRFSPSVSVSVSDLYHLTCWTPLLASVSRTDTCAHTPYTDKSFLTFLYIYETFKRKLSRKQSFESSFMKRSESILSV